MPASNSSSDICLTRIYDAPISAVWDAWTESDQVSQWWGPRGFTLTTEHKDVRTGGSWKYIMHGPDGVDYPNTTKYLEVKKYAKLVYDHGGSEDKPPLFRVTVLFSEIEGKTKMVMTSTLPSPEEAVRIRKLIKSVGGDSTWDRLAEYLNHRATGKDNFVINRAFDAPIDSIFALWTDPKHFAQWLPPTGFTMNFIECDITPGGTGFYCMSNGAGVKMYGLVKYITIQKPDRIVYTQQFSDENKKVVGHPMAPTWPETMLTTVNLTEEGENRTRVTITWEPSAGPTAAEIDTFVKGKAGMTQGWTGSLDKLESYISEARVSD